MNQWNMVRLQGIFQSDRPVTLEGVSIEISARINIPTDSLQYRKHFLTQLLFQAAPGLYCKKQKIATRFETKLVQRSMFNAAALKIFDPGDIHLSA